MLKYLFILFITLLSSTESSSSLFYSSLKMEACTDEASSILILTNSQMRKYARAIYLTDEVKIKLNTNSKNYEEYLDKEYSFLQSKMEETTKQMAYVQIMKCQSIKEKLNRRTKGRGLFYKSQEILDQDVSQSIKSLFSKKDIKEKGIEKLTLSHIKSLVKKGYPTKQGQSLKDLKNKWIKSIESSLKVQTLITDTSNFIKAKGGDLTKAHPYEVPFKYKQIKNELNKKVNWRRYNSIEFKKVLSSYKKYMPIFKVINFFDANYNSFKSLKKRDSKEFQRAKNYFQANLERTLNSTKNKQVLRYLRIAKSLAKTQESELSKAIILETTQYFRTNNYTHKIKASLYQMAKALKDNPKEVSEDFLVRLTDTMKSLKSQLKSDSFYTNRSTPIETIIESKLVKLLKKESMTDYEVALNDLAINIILFDIRKLAYNFKAKLVITLKSLSQKGVSPAIEQIVSSNKLEVFRKKYHQRVGKKWHNVNLTFPDKTKLKGQKAVREILSFHER